MLRVSEVSSPSKISGWHADDHSISIVFEPEIAPGQETSVTIRYSAEPRLGLYFRTPEMGYKPEDTHFWTQGEPTEGRHWFPCFDSPNEKSTSEITCRVPTDMVVASNGRLASETTDTAGLKAVRWVQEKPHAAYLLCCVAGKLKKIEGRHRDIPMAFYTPASQIQHAESAFKETASAMQFFEQEIGVPYPWAKYDQVVVDDFTWGGMENTTITTLTENTLHTSDTENLRSSRGLVAHELAHQWFGDLVTCKDWSHLWLDRKSTRLNSSHSSVSRMPSSA